MLKYWIFVIKKCLLLLLLLLLLFLTDAKLLAYDIEW